MGSAHFRQPSSSRALLRRRSFRSRPHKGCGDCAPPSARLCIGGCGRALLSAGPDIAGWSFAHLSAGAEVQIRCFTHRNAAADELLGCFAHRSVECTAAVGAKTIRARTPHSSKSPCWRRKYTSHHLRGSGWFERESRIDCEVSLRERVTWPSGGWPTCTRVGSDSGICWQVNWPILAVRSARDFPSYFS